MEMEQHARTRTDFFDVAECRLLRRRVPLGEKPSAKGR